MEYEFSFCVSGITHEQADTLLNLVIAYVDQIGGWVGGGFHPVADEEKEVSNGEA